MRTACGIWILCEKEGRESFRQDGPRPPCMMEYLLSANPDDFVSNKGGDYISIFSRMVPIDFAMHMKPRSLGWQASTVPLSPPN